MLLDDISLFLLIVEKGSLTAAGREAGLSPTTVSERLARLEAHYGVALLNRTTRAISLTEAGRTLFEGARRVLGEVEDLDSRIRFGARKLSGPIRISAPSDLGRNLTSAAIATFLAANPEITVELTLSDGYVDIVGLGIDIAIRLGEITDSTLRVRRLSPRRRIVCAAPRYIETHGTPETPADLAMHNCVLMRFGGNLDNVWRFRSGEARSSVTVSGDRIANDGALARQWAIEGHGIALKSQLDITSDLREGRLVELLAEYAAPPVAFQLMFPPGRTQPRRVRALAEHLVATFESAPFC